MIKQLIFLILCLTGVLSFLTAQEAPLQATPANTDGFEKYPECRVYSVATKNAELKEIYEKIDSLSSLRAFYDKDDAKFSLQPQAENIKGIQYNMIVWDGYISIKKSGTYTFILTWNVPGNVQNENHGSICLQVKDQKTLVGHANYRRGALQGHFDVELKAGWNKLRLCVLTKTNMPKLSPSNPVIRYKLRNVIGELRECRPTELTHKVEKEDW